MSIIHNPDGTPVLFNAPVGPSLAVTVDASISASTEITLNNATTYLQVYAITKDVFLKYGTDNVTATDFDEFIIAGTMQVLQLPEGTTAVNVIQREATATVVVIEK